METACFIVEKTLCFNFDMVFTMTFDSNFLIVLDANEFTVYYVMISIIKLFSVAMQIILGLSIYL